MTKRSGYYNRTAKPYSRDMGRKIAAEHNRIPIRHKVTGKEYPSIKEAAKEAGVSTSSLRMVLNRSESGTKMMKKKPELKKYQYLKK